MHNFIVFGKSAGVSRSHKMMIVLLFCLMCRVYCEFNFGADRKILNGVHTQIDKYPFMVGLFYFENFICGASIITTEIVLTAGHCVCVEYTTPETVFVHAGTTNHSDPNTKQFEIASIKCHENLSIEKHYNDIALIKIKGKFELSPTIQTIAVNKENSNLPVGTNCTVIGWGYTEDEEEDFTPALREAIVPITNFSCCKQVYTHLNVTVTDDMLCAGYTNGHSDACKGDSGGPLVFNGIQVGIVAFGNKCGEPCFPGVYTNLSKYNDWIVAGIGSM